MGFHENSGGLMLRLKQRCAFLAAVLLIVGVGTAFAKPETVYVTKTGEKYHRASCNSLRHSKIEMPLTQAVARYAACKICKPPVPVAIAPSTTAAVAPSKPVERSVESARCQATTKKGTQCSRTAKRGGNYCWQHGG
jgi:hypothetical protein